MLDSFRDDLCILIGRTATERMHVCMYRTVYVIWSESKQCTFVSWFNKIYFKILLRIYEMRYWKVVANSSATAELLLTVYSLRGYTTHPNTIWFDIRARSAHASHHKRNINQYKESARTANGNEWRAWFRAAVVSTMWNSDKFYIRLHTDLKLQQYSFSFADETSSFTLHCLYAVWFKLLCIAFWVKWIVFSKTKQKMTFTSLAVCVYFKTFHSKRTNTLVIFQSIDSFLCGEHILMWGIGVCSGQLIMCTRYSLCARACSLPKQMIRVHSVSCKRWLIAMTSSLIAMQEMSDRIE